MLRRLESSEIMATMFNTFKGASSEIFRKWIFFKHADMVTFPTKTSSMVEKEMQIIMYLI